jgi:Zn-finger nucleic acid-binding protein
MFREAVLVCPACGDSVLRPYASRLVCDRCGGFFLSLADLQQVLQDICGQSITLEFFDEEAGLRKCPRCAGPMFQCRLRVQLPGFTSTTKHTLDQCATDGVWFDFDELEDVMARAHWELTHRPSR